MPKLDTLAPTFPAVFGRSYARTQNGLTESLEEVWDRIAKGLGKTHQKDCTKSMYGVNGYKDEFMELKVFPSGRWLWVGGTDWIYDPENVYGAYNCMSRRVEDFTSDIPLFGELAMCGTGTGADLRNIPDMGEITSRFNLTINDDFGSAVVRDPHTSVHFVPDEKRITIMVGDSRTGWNQAYMWLLSLAVDNGVFFEHRHINLTVDFSNVRPKGEPLKGFGGIANPNQLPNTFAKAVDILNEYFDLEMSIDAYLVTVLIDWFAEAVVAGNIRRSAGIREYDYDKHPVSFKSGLYHQNEDGDWVVDPKKLCLRMSNHTVAKANGMFTISELMDLMQRNITSGEDAPKCDRNELMRANRDLLTTDPLYLQWDEQRVAMFKAAWDFNGTAGIRELFHRLSPMESDDELNHRIARVGFNPCGEILGKDFLCNLSEVHANQLDPKNMREINRVFEAAALFASPLLKDEFPDERFQFSREIDPIVGISITGLFDFFYNLFGDDWLYWWKAGRPEGWKTFHDSVDHADMIENLADLLRNTYDDGYDINDVYDQVQSDYPQYHWLNSLADYYTFVEKLYLRLFRLIGTVKVHEYCEAEGLRKPNRCTTIQPSGSKSLLTGASPGWHPPKYKCYVRRITFSVGHPLCKVLMGMGYKVIPGQSSVDDDGQLLPEDAIYDPRCNEWLLEVPCQVDWADLDVNPFEFSALAQLSFYRQVQTEYVTHNTSATVELTEQELDDVTEFVYQAMNEGWYISAAFLSRYDAPYPRLPFEQISAEDYASRMNALDLDIEHLETAMRHMADPDQTLQPEDSACSSGSCMLRVGKG